MKYYVLSYSYGYDYEGSTDYIIGLFSDLDKLLENLEKWQKEYGFQLYPPSNYEQDGLRTISYQVAYNYENPRYGDEQCFYISEVELDKLSNYALRIIREGN